MKNKNILEVCLSPGLGGLEMFVASCYKAFSKRTLCKVVVAPETKLDKYLKIQDKYHIKRSKFFPFLPAWRLAKYIDKNDIEIVHFHWTRDMITVVLAKLFSKKKPKLVQSRHMGMTRFKDDLYHRYMYKNIDMMHAVTKDVAKQLKKFIPADIRPKIEMIYLGVKVPEIDKAKVISLQKQHKLKDEFIVGIVGRIEEGKGQYKVIEAIAKLKDFDIKAFIVGSFMNKEYEKALRLHVKELGVEEKVIFTGFTKNVDEYMQLFDVSILATENETFGLVVIESMANKIAVIATNKGGPLEIIEDGIDGLLFDGSVKDLARNIELLYNNKNLKEAISKAAVIKVKDKFDYTNQLDALYGAMI